jgi:hypothetical protein
MEMGRRDLMRRGTTNRFSNKQQSGSGFSTKSKKGMLKKLGFADEKLKQEMSYDTLPSPDLENEVSKKKSKLPKKVTSSSIRHLNYSLQSLKFLTFLLYLYSLFHIKFLSFFSLSLST